MPASAKKQGDFGFPYGLVFGLLLVAAGYVVAGWQGYVWLRTGELPSLKLLDLLVTMDDSSQSWAAAPTNWIGLHKFFAWASLSGTLMLVGFTITYFAATHESRNP